MQWFFFLSGFFHRHWRFIAGKERGPSLFLSTTSSCLPAFRYLYEALHVKWLPRIFNCISCNYQNATRWDLPPLGITIWLIDDGMLILILFAWWFNSRFLSQQFDTKCGGFELMVYHPSLKSELTNQVL